jgi:hypothetical protein
MQNRANLERRNRQIDPLQIEGAPREDSGCPLNPGIGLKATIYWLAMAQEPAGDVDRAPQLDV